MGFLSSLFKKKEPQQELPLADISNFVKCDMHSHLLPGIDDGAESLQDSIKMIAGLKELGYSNLLCTPHVMHDFYRNSTDTILSGLNQLKEELNKNDIDININAAAEYYFDEELTKRVANKDILTFGQEQYLLFEFSYFNEHQGVFEGITDMIQSGYTPVLAHPERYPYFVMDLEKYDQLKAMGLKFQLNLLSLTGHYGESAIHGSNYLIDKGFVDFIGTDIHRESHLPKLEKALKTERLHQLIDSKILLNHQLAE